MIYYVFQYCDFFRKTYFICSCSTRYVLSQIQIALVSRRLAPLVFHPYLVLKSSWHSVYNHNVTLLLLHRACSSSSRYVDWKLECLDWFAEISPPTMILQSPPPTVRCPFSWMLTKRSVASFLSRLSIMWSTKELPPSFLSILVFDDLQSSSEPVVYCSWYQRFVRSARTNCKRF